MSYIYTQPKTQTPKILFQLATNVNGYLIDSGPNLNFLGQSIEILHIVLWICLVTALYRLKYCYCNWIFLVAPMEAGDVCGGCFHHQPTVRHPPFSHLWLRTDTRPDTYTLKAASLSRDLSYNTEPLQRAMNVLLTVKATGDLCFLCQHGRIRSCSWLATTCLFLPHWGLVNLSQSRIVGVLLQGHTLLRCPVIRKNLLQCLYRHVTIVWRQTSEIANVSFIF